MGDPAARGFFIFSRPEAARRTAKDRDRSFFD
jgi:hypothetical protein